MDAGWGGGWLWVVTTIIGVVVLGAVLAYAAMNSRRRRSPSLDRQRDQAIKNLYDQKD